MKKFVNTKIGIKGFTIFTRVLKEQAENIINDYEKNKSKISAKPPFGNFDCASDHNIKYGGGKIGINLGIDLPEKSRTFEPCIIGTKINALYPTELVIHNEKDISNIMAEYKNMIGDVSKSIPEFLECTVSEIEYSICFDLNELGCEYFTDELWELIRRGLPSSHYSSSKYVSSPDFPYLEFNEKPIRSGSAIVSAKHYRECCKDKIVPINNSGKYSINMICFTVRVATKEIINSIMREMVKSNTEAEIHKNGKLLLMNHLFSEKAVKSVIFKELMRIGINPICIPENWTIDSIPALLSGHEDNDKNGG